MVELVHRREHLPNIEPCVGLFQHARVVEQRPTILTRDIPHREVRKLLRILEGIEQADQSRALDSRQDIPLNKHVPCLIHLD